MYSPADRFLVLRITHQTTLVVKPPSRTTIKTGRFCQRSARPSCEESSAGEIGQRLPGGKAVGEAGAHHAAERRDQHALAEVELANRRGLLFGRELALLRSPSQAAQRDAEQADADAEKDHASRGAGGDLGDLAADDRRNQRPERGAVAERHGHAERDAEIAHGESERQTAESPQHAKRIRPHERASGRRQKRRPEIRDEEPGKDPGRDDPAEHAADEPVGLPGPSAHAAIGNVETGRGQAAYPVVQHSQHWIRTHAMSAP